MQAVRKGRLTRHAVLKIPSQQKHLWIHSSTKIPLLLLTEHLRNGEAQSGWDSRLWLHSTGKAKASLRFRLSSASRLLSDAIHSIQMGKSWKAIHHCYSLWARLCPEKSLNCTLKVKQNKATKKLLGSASSSDAFISARPLLGATQPAGWQHWNLFTIHQGNKAAHPRNDAEMAALQWPSLFNAQKMYYTPKTISGSYLDSIIKPE